MKIKILLGVIFLASAFGLRAATNDLTSLLQQGLFDEEANHDLTSAIADYQSLATQFDRDRQVAATAIYRLGECYRKLGETNEAVGEYQRIIKEFGEQKDLVTLSQQNLTGLGAGAGAGHFQNRLEKIVGHATSEAKTPTTPDTASEETKRQFSAVKKLQEMPWAIMLQVAPTLLPDSTLINLINQYNQSELDLLRLRANASPSKSSASNDTPEVSATIIIQDGIRQKIIDRLNGLSVALSMEIGAAGADTLVPTDEKASHMATQVEMVRKLEATTNFNDVIQIAPTVLDDGILINLIDQYNITDLDLMRAGVAINTDLSTSHSADKEKIREDEALETGISAKISARLAGLEKALTMELRDAVSRGVATTDGQTLDAPSSLGRIYLFGAVRVQGPIELWRNEHLTAGEAILSAGGLGDFANKKQVKLMRTTSGTNETIILDMEQILDRGDTGKDVVLKPGDHILVPSKLFNF